MSRFEPGGARSFMPTAMLDAGDAGGPSLIEIVAHRMEQLPRAGVLEITSANPKMRIDLLEWCHQADHDLFEMSCDGARTWLWIKKR